MITVRGRPVAALAACAASVLVLLSACSQEPAAEAGPTEPATTTAPSTASATDGTDDEFPAAVSRELDIDFGSAPYDRVAACHHDGPVAVQDGRVTFAPSDPSDDLAAMDAEVELSITGAPSYLEIGPEGRSYASVPFSCKAVGGDAPTGADAVVDSGELIVGGTQDDLQVMGLITAGEPVTDDPASDGAADAEASGASAVDLELRQPAGIGTTLLHSSLRNGDGYRYFIREEEDGDTDEPSGRSWVTVAWDDTSGSVRQLTHTEDFMGSVPQPDKTLVMGVDGDNGIIVGQEDLDDREAFEAIAEFLGDPDEESSEFSEDGDHRGYRSETKSWGSFSATYYSPADGEPEWVGTCLAWSGELSDFPQSVTIGSPLQLGSSLVEHPSMGSTESEHVEDGEAPSLVTDGDDRLTVDVVGGTRTDGMITSMQSGTGCARG